jgi:uncharacterized membrane-anchored protein YjiN (DUF445 family)
MAQGAPMPTTINFDDYISEAEKKQIVIDAFRAEASRHSQKDFERIISNSAYHMVGEVVDAHFDGGMVELLKANAIKVINSLSSSTVFSPPNAWDRASSKGFDHMQSALEELKPMIHQRVAELISNYNSEELRELIERQVGEAIIKKLTA